MKTVWEKYESYEDIMSFNDLYKNFLDKAKTEREAVETACELAIEHGFKSLDSYETLKTGDKVYVTNRGKNICLFVMGRQPLTDGMNILGAHIDSPRIDLKQHPIYEDNGLVLFYTHYYGGIKKYQWVTIPLALHGTVAKKDGSSINVVIGEDEKDPVLVISDLLIHIAQEQMEKKANVVIEGEKLDVLVGTKPLTETEEEKDLVKQFLRLIS